MPPLRFRDRPSRSLARSCAGRLSRARRILDRGYTGSVGSYRACRPGPGYLRLVSTDGSWEPSTAGLAFSGQTTPSQGDQVLALTRANPLAAIPRSKAPALALSFTPSAGGTQGSAFGFFSNAAQNFSHLVGGYTAISGQLKGQIGAVLTPYSAGDTNRKLIQLDPVSGVYLFTVLKGMDPVGSYCLLDEYWPNGTTANVYPGFANLDHDGVLGELILLTPGYPIARKLLDLTNPAVNTNFVVSGYVLVEAKITVTGTTAGHKTSILFRYIDEDNHSGVRFAVSGGDVTTELFEVVEGVETVVSSIAGRTGAGDFWCQFYASQPTTTYKISTRTTVGGTAADSDSQEDFEVHESDNARTMRVEKTGTNVTVASLKVFYAGLQQIPVA